MGTFSQSEIDASAPNAVLRNNPGGGSGADYTVTCTILEDENNIGYPLLWQSGNDETAEGFEEHQIGVTCAPDERIAYIVCTEKTNYSLIPRGFSEVSDEIIIHRVFCAALRPTNTDFTFANPIEDITVAASPNTVNVQTVAITGYKAIKSTDTVTVTHTQDFPCVFGICYKHKAKGEIVYDGSTPVIPDPEVELTIPNVLLFSFKTSDAINYFQAPFIIPSGTISGLFLTCTSSITKQCYRLRISYPYTSGTIVENCTDDIVLETDFLAIGDNGALQTLFDSRMQHKTFPSGNRFNVEITVPEVGDTLVLQIYYTNIYNNND